MRNCSSMYLCHLLCHLVHHLVFHAFSALALTAKFISKFVRSSKFWYTVLWIFRQSLEPSGNLPTSLDFKFTYLYTWLEFITNMVVLEFITNLFVPTNKFSISQVSLYEKRQYLRIKKIGFKNSFLSNWRSCEQALVKDEPSRHCKVAATLRKSYFQMLCICCVKVANGNRSKCCVYAVSRLQMGIVPNVLYMPCQCCINVVYMLCQGCKWESF